jgi:hypothetical protein
MNDKKSKQKRRVLAAWLVGGGIYMLLAVEVIAEAGVIAVPFQFIMGALVSIVLVGVAALIGLVLRIPALARLWYASAFPSIAVLAGSAVLLFFGSSWGLTVTLTSTDTGSTYQTLHPAVAYGSMLAAVFATLHFSTGHASLTPERSA